MFAFLCFTMANILYFGQSTAFELTFFEPWLRRLALLYIYGVRRVLRLS